MSKVEDIKILKKFNNGYSWEMNDRSRHRLVSPEGKSNNWTKYEHPAFSFGEKFVIFSEYWEGYVAVETLFELKQVEN